MLVACSDGGNDPLPPTSSSVALTTSLAPGRGDAVPVGYDYPPGSVLDYDLEIVQDIRFEVEGDTSALSSDTAALPASGRVMSEAATEIEYRVAPESTDQAATIGIVADFGEPATTAEVEGDAVSQEDFDPLTAALAVIQPIEFTVGVSDRNAVLTTAGLGGLDVLSGQVGALTSLSNNQISRPLGPVFPESRELRVGQAWRIESVRDGPQGPVVVTTVHRATELREVAGSRHLVIESRTQTDGFEIDFSAEIQSLFAGFASGESGEPVTQEDLEEYADIVFAIGVQPSTGTATTVFDVDRGRVVSSDQESTVRLVWVLETPDEATGEMSGFTLALEIDRTATFSEAR